MCIIYFIYNNRLYINIDFYVESNVDLYKNNIIVIVSIIFSIFRLF